ncbi:hemin ABC transporter substrate-binding protein [Burkholderiaceae bacterium UC74_6]
MPLAHAAPAPRVVVIGGALTEIVYEFGAQGLLVGVDSTSLYPAAATQLPNVGYARTLSAEGLLSLAPSLIVATEDAGPPGVLRQVEAARVPLHVLRADHRFEGLINRTARLGELLDRKAEARALIDRLNQQWTQVRAIRPAAKPPRVLFILSHGMNQVRIAGQETAADAVINYAGGMNALQAPTHGFSGYKPLTPEAVIAAAPDVILCTDQGLEAAGGIDGLLKLPGLAQTPAGQKRRVVAMDALEMLGFGPRLPQAVGKLAKALA